MPEPLLRIISRFDINDSQKSNLNGRAYLSAYNFQTAYKSDLVYAVNRLREVVESPELMAVREIPFKHTVALMWGKSKAKTTEEMIDFFGWEYDDWQENAEISTWQTANGILVRSLSGIQPATCEGGIGILNAETNYRRHFPKSGFKYSGPKIPQTGLNQEYDFCSSQGRIKLRQILEQKTHQIQF